LKVKVNNNLYDVEIVRNGNIKINGEEIDAKPHDNYITINGTEFHLDFKEEGYPSLMIINGMAYLVSRSSLTEKAPDEIRAPISGKVIDIPAKKGYKVERGHVIIVLEAMKMENEIKSPATRWIKDIVVSKGQSVKAGDILVTFDTTKQ
jgi:acetyl/propionyl-CoA carboxylase alpha subunit